MTDIMWVKDWVGADYPINIPVAISIKATMDMSLDTLVSVLYWSLSSAMGRLQIECGGLDYILLPCDNLSIFKSKGAISYTYKDKEIALWLDGIHLCMGIAMKFATDNKKKQIRKICEVKIPVIEL